MVSIVKGSINDFLKFVDLDIVHTEAATLAFYKVALSYLITHIHTHTSYIFRNTLIKVDCPTKASRTLESESWSAQAKLQGRRKQSKYWWLNNKQEIYKYILLCLFVCLIGQLEKRSSPLIGL